MDILMVLGAGYLTTWIMIFSRTYFICQRMIIKKQPNNTIIKYRTLHIFLFVVGTGILTIPACRVAFDNGVRKRFCIGYVNAITG
jgi:hypothetical protein